MSKFNIDLGKAMVSVNIILNEISNLEFRKCLEVYYGKHIPTELVLPKFYLDDCYNEIMKKIRQRVFDRKIWVSLVVTTDAEDRYKASLIIGTLEEHAAIFLLNTKTLGKTNHSPLSTFFDKFLRTSWPMG
jgi:predicted glycosyltransferase involved in capsule biosynthesis